MGRPTGSRSMNSSPNASCTCCNDSQFRRGPWTVEEDELLLNYMKLHGDRGNWRKVPRAAGLLRCGKSCRLRWLNYLRPDLKRGSFSEDEDELIIRLHSLLGNRWSLIAGRIPGRSDNEIKNYWNFHLGKRLLKNGINPRTHKPLSASPMPTKEAASFKVSSFCHSSSFSSISSSVTSCDEDMSSPWEKPTECIDNKDVKPVMSEQNKVTVMEEPESVERNSRSMASQPKNEPIDHDGDLQETGDFSNFGIALRELEIQSHMITFGLEQQAWWLVEGSRSLEDAEKSRLEFW